MNSQELITYINNPLLLNGSTLAELEAMVIEYPYCTIFRILLAKNHKIMKTGREPESLRNASVYVADRKKLFMIMNDIPSEPLIQPATSVYNIEMYGETHTDSGSEQNIKSDSENNLIDNFLGKKLVLSFHSEGENEIDENDLPTESEKKEEFVSEILAEIYEKQGNPERAVRIYEKLIVIYPEKSIYFAAQIEKLRERINKLN